MFIADFQDICICCQIGYYCESAKQY